MSANTGTAWNMQNNSFLWFSFSIILTKSKDILRKSLDFVKIQEIRIREKPYSRLFHAVTKFAGNKAKRRISKSVLQKKFL